MNKIFRKYKFRILLGVIILAVIVAGFYVFRANFISPVGIKTTQLDPTEIPSGFEKNFPVQAGSKILVNSESTTRDGRKQSSRTVTSNQTVEEAVKTFRQYFITEGWKEVQTETISATMISSQLARGNDSVLVVAKNNPAQPQTTVEITLTEAAK